VEPADEAAVAAWEGPLSVRAAVTKALEEERAAKRIGMSLEAEVEVSGAAEVLAPLRRFEEASTVFPGNLANLFIVSRVALRESDGPVAVRVSKAAGAKCERCWTYSENVGRLAADPRVCERCASVLVAR
jgi:isoleucyl-tRNA synthetase